ncbi:hypothetical protein AB0C81_18590 [Streptomyces roseoverticillatus]|uniref:hypothetical protein n=1 Tax=Streptomyces roseoverticillatus TaxID=66429 RepID=UPI00340971B2
MPDYPPAVPATAGVTPALLPHLRPELLAGVTAYGGERDGPPTSEALYWLHLIRQLSDRGSALTAGTRGVAQSHTDTVAFPTASSPLTFLTSCGSGAQHAVQALHRAIRQASAPDAAAPGPQRSPISRLGWAQATCMVRAEAALCAEAATLTIPTTPLGRELRHLTESAYQLYARMAALPAFLSWRATTDPLYASWLDGALSFTAQPPPVFDHCAALYAAFPALGAQAPSHLRSGIPAGNLERYVPDRAGHQWALILSAPAGSADPRGWLNPPAAVIAARAPHHPSATLCYVLAEQAAPQDALRLISRAEGHHTLEEIAASLAVLPHPGAIGTAPATLQS